jgi:Zn finger protein HypA/HybF involved in hydrogenase expression
MANCVNCGAEITDQQFQNFKGLCPPCIRIKNVDSTEDFIVKLIKTSAKIMIPIITIGFILMAIFLW